MLFRSPQPNAQPQFQQMPQQYAQPQFQQMPQPNAQPQFQQMPQQYAQPQFQQMPQQYAQPNVQYAQPQSPYPGQTFVPPQDVPKQKSRVIYTILGLLLGQLGIHNFYAGQYIDGHVKIFILLVASGVLLPVVQYKIGAGTIIVGTVFNGFLVLMDLFFDHPHKKKKSKITLSTLLFLVMLVIGVVIYIVNSL